ncbi:MAG: ECF-type sigma factor [Bryobacteraceae bacterium]
MGETTPAREEVTRLLRAWRHGDRDAEQRLVETLYAELHHIASRLISGERQGHTLQTTALVHEAYLRLAGAEVEWQDRAHFLALSARLMRRILVDHARGQLRAKRGAGAPVVSLDEAMVVDERCLSQAEDIDEALGRLASLDERKSKVVELHYFGGLTYDEMAEVLKISAVTVHRELRFAKSWLNRELARAGQ